MAKIIEASAKAEEMAENLRRRFLKAANGGVNCHEEPEENTINYKRQEIARKAAWRKRERSQRSVKMAKTSIINRAKAENKI